MALSLFRIFSNSINIFYPTLKAQHVDEIVESAYNDQDCTRLGQDHDLFYLILAISSHVARKSDIGLPFTPSVYFEKAISHLEQTRHSWIGPNQILLLQRTILICIYLLLNPSSGDIWRNLGFAIRFYFDLSHRPSEHDGIDEDLMCILTRTLYCLEW